MNNQEKISYLNLKQVCSISGLSPATIYREIAKGKFPRQRQLSSGRVGWQDIEIHQWSDSRAHSEPETSWHRRKRPLARK